MQQAPVKRVGELEIPALGLGTWRMEGRACAEAVANALEMGYRHVDTAQMYGNEEAVGRGVTEAAVDREEVFLTTKVWHDRLRHDDVIETAEACLDRLGTDYVDLLLVHWPNPAVPIEETLDAMHELKRSDWVRHIGVSNFTEPLLDEARSHADDVRVNQVEMHPFFQQRDMHDYCVEHDLALTAYAPLARGRVTDDPVLQEIGEAHDATAAQVALRWLTQQENVVAIPKAEPQDLQRENLRSQKLELTADELDRIGSIEQRPKMVDPGFAPWNG
ncbi:MAG: aldo/keto reductase [Candidatus Nanohaloarchaea archaeon]|nr:aldo/keto reductase [Candidatus Nanohaloarchaea archaeon]